MSPRYLCVIPARGGSKGVVGKNTRPVANKPLLQWTIESALESKADRRVVVSTDSPEIAALAESCGAEVPFLRPAHLAGDDAPTEPTLLHALEHYTSTETRPDAVVLLQATSPIRRRGFVDDAIRQFEDSSLDSLVSVSLMHPFLWRAEPEVIAQYDYRRRPRRQDLLPEDELFSETGSLYITKAAVLESAANRIGGNVGLFKTTRHESIDIDTEADLAVADAILRTSDEFGARK